MVRSMSAVARCTRIAGLRDRRQYPVRASEAIEFALDQSDSGGLFVCTVAPSMAATFPLRSIYAVSPSWSGVGRRRMLELHALVAKVDRL